MTRTVAQLPSTHSTVIFFYLSSRVCMSHVYIFPLLLLLTSARKNMENEKWPSQIQLQSFTQVDKTF